MIASIITVALAAISGLTFIAYKHPVGYRKIYVPLIVSVWAAWIIWMVYSYGQTIGFYEALRDTQALNKGTVIQTPSLKSDPMWWFLVSLAVVGYLSFLRALPSILELPAAERQ